MPRLAPKTTDRVEKRGPRARRVIDRAPRFRSWHTTDEEEIERRRQRGTSEPLAVQPLEPQHPVFGTFRVSSEGGGAYEVEIRSLSQRDNSCGCPDYQINGLGTCKHVEAVLARLAKRRSVRTGPERIEVFLRTTGEMPEVRIQIPPGSPGHSAAGRLLAPFFAEDGALLGDPVTSLPALARALAGTQRRVKDGVRLSRHLLPWVDEQRRRAARRTAREQLLAEVEAGRQSLDLVKHPLFPYQQEGMLHLAFTERALLADEMGLGKTVQAIAACELLRRLRGVERVLVVSPASLKAEWEEQIARFTDHLPVRVLQGTRAQRLRQYGPGAFFYLANYEQVLTDGDDLQRRLAPDVIILDEAQRIKNWQSKTAAAVKRLRSQYAFVLTGTPLENRIDEIYSIVQFLDPSLLGPLFRFNREFYRLDERGRPAGYRNLDELHRRLSAVLLRRRKSEVEGQLPSRSDKHYFVPLEEEQFARYSEYEARVAKLAAIVKRRPLTPEEHDKLQQWLACMRMVCDTPYILDSDCRICPKLVELEEVLREVLADPQAKILVFSEWERMLELVRELVQEMGLGFAWHTGSVPQQARRKEIRRFKDDPACRLFLSTDSGGVGLNLQAANVVINLDLPWNPARLEQRIARAWRKHQTRPVQVIYLVAEGTIEHRMIPLLAGKQALAEGVLDGSDLREMPLPSGRAALVERLQAILGTHSEPAGTGTAADPARAGAPERLRDDLVAELGGRLLLLESRPGPTGGESLLAVVDRAAIAERPRLEALLRQQIPADAPAPSLELIDRATFEAIERLAAAGFLQLTPEGRQLLHRSAALEPGADAERSRRLAEAQETFAQAERKIRMAATLSSGGFPVEALPALREGVELALRSSVYLQGLPLAEHDEVPLGWVRDHLPAHLPLVSALRSSPEALLAVGEASARQWVREGEELAERVGIELRGAGEPAPAPN